MIEKPTFEQKCAKAIVNDLLWGRKLSVVNAPGFMLLPRDEELRQTEARIARLIRDAGEAYNPLRDNRVPPLIEEVAHIRDVVGGMKQDIANLAKRAAEPPKPVDAYADGALRARVKLLKDESIDAAHEIAGLRGRVKELESRAFVDGLSSAEPKDHISPKTGVCFSRCDHGVPVNQWCRECLVEQKEPNEEQPAPPPKCPECGNPAVSQKWDSTGLQVGDSNLLGVARSFRCAQKHQWFKEDTPTDELEVVCE